MNACTIF